MGSKSSEMMASDALLLGRTAYEGFCKAWPSRSGEFADSETLILIYEPAAKDEKNA
jgi:hypothetical protein